MKRLLIILLAVGLISSILIVGCSSASTTSTPPITQQPTTTTIAPPATSPPPTQSQTSTAGTPKRGGIMKVAGPPDPGGPFGWPPDIKGPAAATAQPVLEPLMRQLIDGSYVPWLATSYDLASDKSSITFHLRQGVQFSDGTPFDANSVKINFDAQIAGQNEPYWKSVDVIDANTVRLNLTSWTNVIFDSFSDAAPIASPAAFQKNGQAWADKNPVGTGPFIFQSYEQGAKAIFTRNPNYWQTGKPYLDGIEIDYIMDPLTMKAAMQSGQIDMMNVTLGQQQQDLQNAGFSTAVKPNTVYALIPDTANPSSPFAKLEVRQAVEYAINRPAMAQGLGYGQWQPPYQLPPRSNAAYNPNFPLGLKYNSDKAKQLLAQAGFPNGFSTSIIAQPAARQDDADAAIQSYLNAVGIKTELKNVDQGTFANYQLNGWTNALMITPLPGFANYNSTLNFYFVPSSTQFKSWAKTDEFVADLNASFATPTPDINLIRKVTDYMIQNTLVIPTTESGLGYAYASYVKDGGFEERGFPTNWNMDSVWLDK